jgi:protein-disulfide isomerase
MKINPIIFILLTSFSFVCRAEMPGQDRDMEAIRMMQAKADAARMEDEYQHPKMPKIEKDRAILGDKKAPLMIVEFSDFQCPYCKQGYSTVEELRKKYGKKLAVMFKHFPLPFHPMAMPAAKHFEAIAMQSGKKAYAFYDEIFKNQDDMVKGGEAYMDDVAKRLKVNVAKMKKDMESPKVDAHIKADMAEATEFGITGTPGFVVTGVLLKGAYPAPMFETILDKRLQDSSRSIASKKE